MLKILILITATMFGAAARADGELHSLASEAIGFYHGGGQQQDFENSGVNVNWGDAKEGDGESSPGKITIDKGLKQAPPKWIAHVIAHEWVHHRDGHVDIPPGDPAYDWPSVNCTEFGVYCEMYGILLNVGASGDFEPPEPDELCPDCAMMNWLRGRIIHHGRQCHGFPLNDDALLALCPGSSSWPQSFCD